MLLKVEMMVNFKIDDKKFHYEDEANKIAKEMKRIITKTLNVVSDVSTRIEIAHIEKQG